MSQLYTSRFALSIYHWIDFIYVGFPSLYLPMTLHCTYRFALISQPTYQCNNLVLIQYIYHWNDILPVGLLWRWRPGFGADQFSHFHFLRFVLIRDRGSAGIGLHIVYVSAFKAPWSGFLTGLVPDHHRLTGDLVQVLASVVEYWEEFGIVLEKIKINVGNQYCCWIQLLLRLVL